MEQWGCCPVCKFEVELRQGRTELHARLHATGSMRRLCGGSYAYPCEPPAELTAEQETALMGRCDSPPEFTIASEPPLEQYRAPMEQRTPRQVYSEPISLRSLLSSTALWAAPDGGR